MERRLKSCKKSNNKQNFWIELCLVTANGISPSAENYSGTSEISSRSTTKENIHGSKVLCGNPLKQSPVIIINRFNQERLQYNEKQISGLWLCSTVLYESNQAILGSIKMGNFIPTDYQLFRPMEHGLANELFRFYKLVKKLDQNKNRFSFFKTGFVRCQENGRKQWPTMDKLRIIN